MADGSPESTTAEDRFTLAVWRALRDSGEALTAEQVEDLGAASGLDAKRIARRLSGMSERDDHGSLLGLGGLSVADHPHRLSFESTILSTWCAWDPFFLVPSLGGSARLETVDPVSGVSFTVDFVDGRAVRQAGGEPVLSMVDGDALQTLKIDAGADGEVDDGDGSARSVEELWSSFCSHVHLFESADTARQFFEGRGVDFELLSVDQASAYANETRGQLIRAARTE